MVACLSLLLRLSYREPLLTSAAGQICRTIANRQQTSTAVLAATGLNLLKYESPAVARTAGKCSTTLGCWLAARVGTSRPSSLWGVHPAAGSKPRAPLHKQGVLRKITSLLNFSVDPPAAPLKCACRTWTAAKQLIGLKSFGSYVLYL